MKAEIGSLYEQIKNLDGFPYNNVGAKWRVSNAQGKYTVLKSDGIGLGVDDAELAEHFRLVDKLFDDEDTYEDEPYDDDYEEEEEEEVVKEEPQPTKSDKVSYKLMSMLKKTMGFRK